MYDKECNTACDDRELGRIAAQANIHAGLCGIAASPISERVKRQRAEAEHNSRKADRLRELEELLAKHRDVARILDLLEEVR